MRKCKKILGLLLMIICCALVYKNVHATTITAPGSVEKGKSVTITVSVPNVNTVDLIASHQVEKLPYWLYNCIVAGFILLVVIGCKAILKRSKKI